jgi:hypothetical protein
MVRREKNQVRGRRPQQIRQRRRRTLRISISLGLAVAVHSAAMASAETIVNRDLGTEQTITATGVSISPDGCTSTESTLSAFRDHYSVGGSGAQALYFWSSVNSCTGESEGGFGRTFGQGYNYPGFFMTVTEDSARLVVDIATSDGSTWHVDETWTATGPPVTETVIGKYMGDTYTTNYRYTGRLRPATVTGSLPVSSGFFGTARSGSMLVART